MFSDVRFMRGTRPYGRGVLIAVALVVATATGILQAARQPGNALQQYLKVSTPVTAIVHVRVIDGTGAPPREDQTVVIRDGKIAQLGPAASTPPPEGATVVDGAGKSLIPGLV